MLKCCTQSHKYVCTVRPRARCSLPTTFDMAFCRAVASAYGHRHLARRPQERGRSNAIDVSNSFWGKGRLATAREGQSRSLPGDPDVHGTASLFVSSSRTYFFGRGALSTGEREAASWLPGGSERQPSGRALVGARWPWPRAPCRGRRLLLSPTRALPLKGFQIASAFFAHLRSRNSSPLFTFCRSTFLVTFFLFPSSLFERCSADISLFAQNSFSYSSVYVLWAA